jgi:hypothetical protein
MATVGGFDKAAVGKTAAWLRLLTEPGQVTELRALHVRPPYGRPCTASGYFKAEGDGLERMAEAALQLSHAPNLARGVYFTLNPVQPDLIARRCERVDRAEDGELTGDRHIVRRRLFLVDVDPVRDAKISASDAEKALALAAAVQVRDHLHGLGWPGPVRGDTGNGAALFYAVDLPNDDASRVLIERCLQALAARFDSDRVKIDQSVFNAARICKVPGTWARKGDDISERPHRPSRLLEVPGCADPDRPEGARLEVVPRELLEALAPAPVQPPPRPPIWAVNVPPRGTPYSSRLDVCRWLQARAWNTG